MNEWVSEWYIRVGASECWPGKLSAQPWVLWMSREHPPRSLGSSWGPLLSHGNWVGTRAPGNPGFLHASWSQGSWQGPGFLALVLSRLMGLWRCSSSSAKQANPKVTASAQRIALHFSSIQMNSVRVYCTPFITATWGSRGCKTPFLPSGSLSTSNLINYPDGKAVWEFRGAGPCAVPTEPPEVCAVDIFQAGINHDFCSALSQTLLKEGNQWIFKLTWSTAGHGAW